MYYETSASRLFMTTDDYAQMTAGAMEDMAEEEEETWSLILPPRQTEPIPAGPEDMCWSHMTFTSCEWDGESRRFSLMSTDGRTMMKTLVSADALERTGEGGVLERVVREFLSRPTSREVPTWWERGEETFRRGYKSSFYPTNLAAEHKMTPLQLLIQPAGGFRSYGGFPYDLGCHRLCTVEVELADDGSRDVRLVESSRLGACDWPSETMTATEAARCLYQFMPLDFRLFLWTLGSIPSGWLADEFCGGGIDSEEDEEFTSPWLSESEAWISCALGEWRRPSRLAFGFRRDPDATEEEMMESLALGILWHFDRELGWEQGAQGTEASPIQVAGAQAVGGSSWLHKALGAARGHSDDDAARRTRAREASRRRHARREACEASHENPCQGRASEAGKADGEGSEPR